MMKHLIYASVIVLLISCTSSGDKTTQQVEETAKKETSQPIEKKIMSGGYTEARALQPDETTLFSSMTSGLKGVIYSPTSVATQVVAGTNYRFVCQATPTTPDAKSYEVEIIVYQPLPAHGDPRITSLTRL